MWALEDETILCSFFFHQDAFRGAGEQVLALCKKGRVQEAISIFKQHPDTAGATSLISACAGRPEHGLSRAFEVLRTLTASSVKPNAHVFTALVVACQKCGNPRKALPLIDAMAQHNVGLNAVCFGTLANACAATGDAVGARKLLNIWRKKGQGEATNSRTAVRALKIMQAFAKQRDLDSVFEALELMRRDGAQPTPPIFTTLIDACLKCGRPERALPLRHIMQQNNISLLHNEVLFKCFVRVCAETGDLDATEYLLDGLMHPAQGPTGASIVQPNDVDCTQLLTALVKAEALEKALKAFTWLVATGYAADSDLSYIVLLTGCADVVALKEGRELHARLGDRWKTAASVTQTQLVSALINMYGKCGEPDAARAVFDAARAHSGTGLGLTAWNAMLNALGLNGRGTAALELLQEMAKGAEQQPNDVTLVCVLNACSHAGLADDALNLLKAMKSRWHVPPDEKHLTCVVDALGRAGRLQEAEELTMRGFADIKPNFVTWQTLLGACRWHQDAARVQRLLPLAMNLAGSEDLDNIASLHTLEANVYGASQRWDEHSRVLNEMKEKGLKKQMGKTWIVVNGEVSSFIAHDVSHPKTKEIYAEIEQLEQELKGAGFVCDTRFVTHNVSDDRKERLLCHHSEKLALALGLISTPAGTLLLMKKNLRVCPNCHAATALISKLRQRAITMRDANRFHHFVNGKCSCNNHW